MCSIPGLPTVGTKTSLIVTRVNLDPCHGLVKLWVKIYNHEKFVHARMNEICQIPKSKFYEMEGKPGDLCLVCIRDRWHRARIVSVHNQNYNLYLIDQGRSHSATIETLAWGQSDCFLLPPEIESCILANVLSVHNDWPERATKFLNSLPSKRFIGLVQHVLMADRTIILDIPVISKHMVKVGVARKIPVEQFKCLALESLKVPKAEPPNIHYVTEESIGNLNDFLVSFEQYFYPQLQSHILEIVEVTEVKNPENIYCKLQIFSDSLMTFTEEVHQHYKEDLGLVHGQPQGFGSMCAAKGLTGRWHRSLLRQNVTGDEGIVEVLHVDSGKSEHVAVEDIRPLDERFQRMPVFTYQCSLNGVTDYGTCWTQGQIDSLKSFLTDQTVVARFDSYDTLQDLYYVTFYGTNGVCINTSFMEKIRQFPNKGNAGESVLFTAITNEVILNYQSNGSVKVDVSQEKMSTPSENRALDGGKEASFEETSVTRGLHNAEDASPQLCCPSLGLDDDMFPVGSTTSVKILCVESLQKFWCQNTNNGETLQQLMHDINEHYAAARPQPLLEPVCVARNPDDGMLYRAQIMECQRLPVVDVRFIDYGQTKKVPLRDVHLMDPALLRLRAQAVRCCLFSQRHPTDPTATNWSDAALAEFQKFVDSASSSNSELKCIVKCSTFDKEGPLIVVDFEIQGGSFSKILYEEFTPAEASVHLPPMVSAEAYTHSTYNLEVGVKENVLVTCAENVHHFYCQLDRNSHVVESLSKQIQLLIGQAASMKQSVGESKICLARHTDDQWRRGLIVKTSPNLLVHFVDYGDTLTINEPDILPCPPDASTVLAVPVQAVPLALYEVPTDFPQEMSKWFADLSVGHSFTISVVAKEANGKLLVELCDGSLQWNQMVRDRIGKVKPLLSIAKQAALLRDHRQSQKNVLPPWGGTPHAKHSNTSEPCTGVEVGSNLQSITQVIPPQHGFPEEERQVMPRHARVTDLPPRFIDEGSSAEVFISHFSSTSNFFVQLQKEDDKLNYVMEKLNKSGSSAPVDFHELQIGDLLKAQSDDGLWYRAVVECKREGEMVDVVFIDYGSGATIPHVKSCQLDDDCVAFSKFGIACGLSGANDEQDEWDEVAVSILKVTKPKNPKHTYSCNFIKDTGRVWTVTLTDKETVRSETLSPSTDLIANKGELASVRQGSVGMCKYKDLSNVVGNKTVEVYASCIVSPHYFWCQYADTEDLAKLSALAQAVGQKQPHSMEPEMLGPGSPCLAMFSSDNQWYRAQVISRTDSTLHVLFMDYGNELEVSICNVRSVSPSLMEKPPLAFLCSLDGFNDSQGFWDDGVYDDFCNLLVDKLLSVTVMNMEHHLEIGVPRHTVKIVSENVVVNAVMQRHWKAPAIMETSPDKREALDQIGKKESVSAHHICSGGNLDARKYKNPDVSPGKTLLAHASCIVGPHYFWCQHANTGDLNDISKLVQEVGDAKLQMISSQMLKPGSPCLALFCKQWCRAQVTSKPDKTVCVLFVDHGTASEVDVHDLRSVPAALMEKAPQAFLCSLDGFDESKGSWHDDVSDHFRSHLADKLLSVTVLNMEDHCDIAVSRYVVKVKSENVVVNLEMQKYWKVSSYKLFPRDIPQTDFLPLNDQTDYAPMCNTELPFKYKKPNVSPTKMEQVYASCIVGPQFFWCQYANTDELNAVTKLAQEIGSRQADIMSHPSLNPGSACLALFSSDNQWHRAQVINRTDATVSVVFIDYGNEADVDIKDVRFIPQSLFERTPQAFLCVLDGFRESTGEWEDGVYDDFFNLLVDKKLSVTVIDMEVDVHSGPRLPQFAVRVKCGSLNVNAKMERYWRSSVTLNSPTKERGAETKMLMYMKPNISCGKTEVVYASCIVGLQFFWCQYANTEELVHITELAQEAGNAVVGTTPQMKLDSSSPCLALFPTDNQWHRAQVIHSTNSSVSVLFVDYGNESVVDLRDVRSIPPALMEHPPQAFLCALDGFDNCTSSRGDSAYDDFYKLIADKPLAVTVMNVEDDPQMRLPLHTVKMECDNADVSTIMKHKCPRFAMEHSKAQSLQSDVNHRDVESQRWPK